MVGIAKIAKHSRSGHVIGYVTDSMRATPKRSGALNAAAHVVASNVQAAEKAANVTSVTPDIVRHGDA